MAVDSFGERSFRSFREPRQLTGCRDEGTTASKLASFCARPSQMSVMHARATTHRHFKKFNYHFRLPRASARSTSELERLLPCGTMPKASSVKQYSPAFERTSNPCFRSVSSFDCSQRESGMVEPADRSASVSCSVVTGAWTLSFRMIIGLLGKSSLSPSVTKGSSTP
jgi:hypothetical protein